MKTLRYDDVKVGDELPGLDVPITATAIVAGAIASRDYQDVHHDKATAIQRGSPDIFMNILTTNGYVGRFVTDWAGPEALLREVDIVLGAPNYPGDLMRMSGQVIAKDAKVSKVQASNALNSTIDGILTSLKKGGKVTLVGFGTFSVSSRKARTGRNPQTGAPLKIPAKKVTKFVAGAELKKAVNKGR